MIKSTGFLIKISFLFHLVATSSLAMDIGAFSFVPLLGTSVPSGNLENSFGLSRNSIIAIGDNDGVIRILDAANGITLRQWTAHTGDQWGYYKNIGAISISPDNRLVVSGSHDKTAKISDISNGTLCHSLNGHKSPVHNVIFSSDGTLIATAALDGTAKIWETASGKMLHSLDHQGQGYGVWSVDFSPDNAFIVTTSSGSINIWNVVTGQHVISLIGHAPGYDITKALYSPDGTKILSTSYDKTARIWDAASGTLLHTCNLFSKAEFVCFGPDSNQIMAACRSCNGCSIWDIDTETIVQSFYRDYNICTVSYNANSKCLLTASGGDNAAKIIDKITGNLLHTLKHDKPVRRADFVPFSNNIITICEDNMTRIWVLPTDELSNPQKLAKKIYINTVKEYMNQLGQKKASYSDFIEFFTNKYPANELGYAAYVENIIFNAFSTDTQRYLKTLLPTT